MIKVVKKIWNVVEVVIIVYVVMMTILFLNKNSYGFTEVGKYVFANYDSSLTNMNEYKLLIIKKSKELKDGDLVYYYSINKEKYIVEDDTLVIKNDEYYLDDVLVERERIIGSKATEVPVIGRFLMVIESKIGFILLVLLPILLVFIYQVYEFVIDSKEERKKVLESALIDDEII